HGVLGFGIGLGFGLGFGFGLGSFVGSLPIPGKPPMAPCSGSHWMVAVPGAAKALPASPLTVTYQPVSSLSLALASLGRTFTSMRMIPGTWLAATSWRQCQERLARSTSPLELPDA